MPIGKVVSILAGLMLLLILPTTILAAEPAQPSVFGGTATLDGAPAPDGTPVSAVIDGTEVAATTVANGAYAFTISQPPDESYSGKTITFLEAELRDAEDNLLATASSTARVIRKE